MDLDDVELVAQSALGKAKKNKKAIDDLLNYVTVTEAADAFACNVGGARVKNFAFAIGDTDAKTITLSNLPDDRCEIYFEIKTTAATTVAWTLNGGTLVWNSITPPVSLEANKTYEFMVRTDDGGDTLNGYAPWGF